MVRVALDSFTLADLECLGNGAYAPLEGFMGRADYESVVAGLRLADGRPWPLPVCLRVPDDLARRAVPGRELALCAPGGEPVAVLEVSEVFEADPAAEAQAVFGTTDPAHPGVARLLGQPRTCLAGRVAPARLAAPDAAGPAALPGDPAATRALLRARGWRTVVGFQTRNPIHRAHEYLLKCALEQADGVLVHPLVGETRADDIPADVRLACYRTVLERYFPPDRVLLGVFPGPMRYAGPREAVFHALVRKNYGCTHFIVGRDHAGVGRYYDPFAAHRIFDRFRPGELGIDVLRFDSAFYCRACGGMASDKTCPHGELERFTLSGTRLRQLLRAGLRPPAEIIRPEVADLLSRAYGAPARPGPGPAPASPPPATPPGGRPVRVRSRPNRLAEVVADPLAGRLAKPRTTGWTMVLDKGMGVARTRDFLELAAPYVDFLKLTFGSPLLYADGWLAEKVRLARQWGVEVYPGGTLLEVAWWQGRPGEFLAAARAVGIRVLELSDGTVPMSPANRRALLETLREAGFRVITEVGKKHPGDQPDLAQLAATAVADLDAGAEKVIVEGRESGRGTAVLDPDGAVVDVAVRALVDAVGDPDRLIWEAPQTAQQLAFIRAFGANVNLGNIPPDDVLALEALRRGLRGDTLRDVVHREQVAMQPPGGPVIA